MLKKQIIFLLLSPYILFASELAGAAAVPPVESIAGSPAVIKLDADIIEMKILEFQKSHYMNGAVAVAQGPATLYAKGFGVADHSTRQLCTKDTQFFIGSVTKQFTAAALLHVLWNSNPSMEALKVALQQPLVNFLPETHPIWGGSMPEWAKRITLHHLLTHTSGIASFTALPSFQSVVGNAISAVELANMFKNEPLNFEPGAKYEYSNSGYFLLGEVVVQLSGKTLSQYLSINFFTPLNMRNSLMPKDGSGKTMKESGDYPTLARGYYCDIEPTSPMFEIEKYYDNTFLNGAGGIVSTVSDLLIWNYKLHHNMVLPEEVTELMLSEHVQMDPQKKSIYYCYGIMKLKFANGDVFTHSGSVEGFSTVMEYLPHDQVSFVAFKNLRVGDAALNAIVEQEYNNPDLKNIKDKKELCDKVETAIEEKFPGFRAAKKRHELMYLKDIVNLETK